MLSRRLSTVFPYPDAALLSSPTSSSSSSSLTLSSTLPSLRNSLGAYALALHYAHTIMLVDRIVNKPTLILRTQRYDAAAHAPSNRD